MLASRNRCNLTLLTQNRFNSKFPPKVSRTNGELNFLSAMPPKEEASYVVVTDGKDHPNYQKDDVVQGHRTYVLHYEVGKEDPSAVVLKQVLQRGFEPGPVRRKAAL